MKENSHFQKKVLKWTTRIILICYIGVIIMEDVKYVDLYISNSEPTLPRHIIIFEDLIQFLQAYMLCVIGIKLIRRLKEYHPEFYDDNRKKLIMAVVGMTLPLGIKTIHNLCKTFIDEYNEYIHNNYAYYKLFYSVICDFIPLFF